MKHKPNESIEEWAERVSTHEYGLAVKQIAAGKDVDLVMQAMSVKILEKLKVAQTWNDDKMSEEDLQRILKSPKDIFSYNHEALVYL